MNQPIALPTKRRCGNPNWGKPIWCPSIQTEFEKQVAQLGLSRAEYVYSAELRRWCEVNRNRCYVPEWLLEIWGIEVEAMFSGVA